MDALHERVLGEDDTILQFRGVVLDSRRQPAPLELGQNPGLADLREPHRSQPGGSRPNVRRE